RDRCFHCKTALFDVLEPLAAELGLEALALGTVIDDLDDHRPGLRAAAERGVVAPLVEAGLSKADVRALSRERGLPTWDKPAAAWPTAWRSPRSGGSASRRPRRGCAPASATGSTCACATTATSPASRCPPTASPRSSRSAARSTPRSAASAGPTSPWTWAASA